MSNKKQKKVLNLQDLADLAGVSRATASRALSDSPLISSKTKDKLRALAKKHNYTVNSRARDFRLQRTGIIAVIFMLDIESEQHMSDPFFLDMLGGVADALAENDYDLLLTHAPIVDVLDLRNSRAIQQSDGVIVIGQGEQHQQLKELAADDRNIVVWGYPVADKNYVVVGGDNFTGGYEAAKHLLHQNRRKIAFFGKTDNPENAARYEGYVKAHTEFGLETDPQLKLDIPFSVKLAQEALVHAMQDGLDIDAVVCAADVMALATISTLQTLGKKVPNDIAVVGYDDISLATYSNPPLTTVRQNIHWAGKVLVDSVLGLINGEQVPDTMLATELVVRRSSGVDET